MSPPLEQRIERDSSFERLYRQHRRDVYGAVLRDVRDPAEAEDVTQIAFLNAFRAMRKGEHPDKPRAWLVTIARNVIRRRYRELMRRPQEVALDPEVAVALAEVDGPTAGEIASAIRRLPDNQRKVILLREIQGRSYAEIAEEMELSLAAVETLIFRARRSLSGDLEQAERVPTTRSRRRGFFFLPIPGLSKLSFGFSLGRAGAAALAGSVAMVAVPLDSSVGTAAPPTPARISSVGEAVGPSTDPSSMRLGKTGGELKEDRRTDTDTSKRKDTGDRKRKASALNESPSVPTLDVPSLTDGGSALVSPPPVQAPSLEVDPPQLPVEPPPLPVEPPPLPDLPAPPSVDLPPVPSTDLPPPPSLDLPPAPLG